MKKILNTKKYTLFLAMIFLGACNEAEKPKVSNSPCDFSFDFSFGEELQEVLSCISTHFPIGSDPIGLHEYLMAADFSSVNIAVDNPRNYLKDRHDLSSRRDQFLVYLDKDKLVKTMRVNGYKYIENKKSWVLQEPDFNKYLKQKIR